MTKWTIPDRQMRIDAENSLMRAMQQLGQNMDRIEALEAENARLRAAHLAIIQSAPILQYAIQTSRDALYPKEGGE